ncbi:MAG: hypothetical protein Q9225_000131 [Loekoesia sp. 1 TL-2023]
MTSSSWALSQIAHVLPLDEPSLQEILDYTSTLSKDAAAEHLRNLLGTSPKALEFISSYNSRREAPRTESRPSTPEAPDLTKKPRKKRQPLNKPFNPRQPEDYGNTAGGYQKKTGEDYISGQRQQHKETPLVNTLALSDKPDARQLPIPVPPSGSSSPKKPPSAAGPLISDLPNVRTGSRSSSRTSSPAPKAKDSAIRALELQTNPSLTNEPTPSRTCSCNATRHPLLAAAPNCLNCGKIICVKEGIGPCTFCSHPLLSPAEINGMIRALREERGKERMSANNASHKRADLATTPRPFTPSPTRNGNTSSNSTDPSLAAAQQHRDKLLAFQSQNARRTHIIDEAADFDTPVSGQNIWASPIERAKQLKRQQKVLREQEWNARPEWEKRKVVVSIDVSSGKAVRRMEGVERPKEEEDEVVEENEMDGLADGEAGGGGNGAFSRNPLMGGLIRPVWKGKGEKGKDGTRDDGKERQEAKWRRVQDDNEDNEAWILDGGIYGGRRDVERTLGDEEHAYG